MDYNFKFQISDFKHRWLRLAFLWAEEFLGALIILGYGAGDEDVEEAQWGIGIKF